MIPHRRMPSLLCAREAVACSRRCRLLCQSWVKLRRSSDAETARCEKVLKRSEGEGKVCMSGGVRGESMTGMVERRELSWWWVGGLVCGF